MVMMGKEWGWRRESDVRNLWGAKNEHENLDLEKMNIKSFDL
jgi:hypothetical protein